MLPSQQLTLKIERGDLRADSAQSQTVALLDDLAQEIARMPRGLLGVFANRRAPKGLYLWGGVGRGKSMLMDLFFDNVPIRRKRRVHFHEFMAERHGYMKQIRDRRAKLAQNQDDLIGALADDVIEDARLLCFDEVQVTDIGDAMILGRLFERILDAGVVIVATSNRPPHDLYKNGVNRQLFEPFIHLLETRLGIVELQASRDYRLERLLGAPVYYSPLDEASRQAMDETWRRLTFGAQSRAVDIHVLGHRLHVPQFAAACARFSFAELCETPLGPSDYLALADYCSTLLVDDVPSLSASARDAARRFVTLVDALYERKTKLILSSQDPIDQLYPEGDGAFEFARTRSRLVEMGSKTYLSAARFTAFDAAQISET